MIEIRKACIHNAEDLKDLYLNHLTSTLPQEPQDIDVWKKMIASFEQDPYYHLLVGIKDQHVVSSVTLIIIRNLTHNHRPYALIENVVTHNDYRGHHYASMLIDQAVTIAKEADCYKVMLMTGSKEKSTLNFYKNCGFDPNAKKAFLKKL